MKNLVVPFAKFTLCLSLIAALMFPMFAYSGESKDYVAKAREDGKFCAKVEVRGVNGMVYKKKRCKTLAQWAASGYTVTEKK